MSEFSITASFGVPADHPALAGHFPGNPVVPGVVLLDQVAKLLARKGFAIRRIVDVRFRQVLHPGVEASVKLDGGGGTFRFLIEGQKGVIASGRLEAGQ